jgi:tRNA(fMet)-specific endonuclease VapC
MEMTGNETLVESSIIIDVMRGDINVSDRLERLPEIYLNPIILSELYIGAYRSDNPNKNLNKIVIATKDFKLLIIDATTAQHFVSIKLYLFAKGTPIPENDIWIAASAMQHGLSVYKKDAHFKNINGLNLL